MWEREDIDVMSTGAQVLHQFSIVEITAGNLVQLAVNDEPDMHGAEYRSSDVGRASATPLTLFGCASLPMDLA